MSIHTLLELEHTYLADVTDFSCLFQADLAVDYNSVKDQNRRHPNSTCGTRASRFQCDGRPSSRSGHRAARLNWATQLPELRADSAAENFRGKVRKRKGKRRPVPGTPQRLAGGSMWDRDRIRGGRASRSPRQRLKLDESGRPRTAPAKWTSTPTRFLLRSTAERWSSPSHNQHQWRRGRHNSSLNQLSSPKRKDLDGPRFKN